MTNPPRKKGSAAESAVVRHVRTHGFAHADRQPLRGSRDQGDLTLCPGVVVEVKAHAVAATGQPPPRLLTRWLEQTAVERDNAGADHGLLVVKRAGTTNPGTWWCYLPLGGLCTLVGATQDDAADPDRWVCMTLDTTLAVLRAAGWGQPLDGQEDVA